jgi:hypothetical protein
VQREATKSRLSNFTRYIFPLLCLSLMIDIGMFNFWCEWTVLDRGSCYSVNITCFRDVRKEMLAREAIYWCVASSDSPISLSATYKAHLSVTLPHTCQYYERYYFLEGWVGYEMDTTSSVQARLNNLQALLRYTFMSFCFQSRAYTMFPCWSIYWRISYFHSQAVVFVL